MTRIKELENILGLVREVDTKGLKKFIKSPPPNPKDVVGLDSSQNEEPIFIETLNKSFPYVCVYRDLELDKENNPIYSFRFVSRGITPETKEIYLGSFGAQEVLEALSGKQKSNEAKFEAMEL